MSLWLQSDGFLPNEFQVRVNNTVILRTDILIAPYTQINLGFFPTSPDDDTFIRVPQRFRVPPSR